MLRSCPYLRHDRRAVGSDDTSNAHEDTGFKGQPIRTATQLVGRT